MKQTNKPGIFNDKRIVLLIAVVMAFLSWVIIAGFINPNDVVLITYVDIDYEQEADHYRELGLQITTAQQDLPSYADVQVRGDGVLINPMSSNAVTVYADYTQVRGAGTYDIPLRAAPVAAGDYTITGMTVRGSGYSVESNPKISVTMVFEEVESKSFTIVARADGVTAAPGYFRDSPRAEPTEVLVTGPKNRVEQIAQVVAQVSAEEELDERKKYMDMPLVLLDENGQELDVAAMGLTLSTHTADVEVRILETRTIGLQVDFTGLPQNFDTEWFYERVSLSEDELQVAGSSGAFANIDDPYTIATFNLSQMTMGWESDPINIELGEGLRNLDQLRQVTVSLDTADFAEKAFEVRQENFRVRNGPRNATIEPVPASVTVRLMGDAEQIAALLPEDITVEIDAFSVTGSGGQQTIPVRVVVSGADRVFAQGSYSMVCDVRVSG